MFQRTTESNHRAVVHRAECLDRLLNNPDFQELFLEYYTGQFAADLVLHRAKPYVQRSPAELESADRSILAIGEFSQFLHGVQQSRDQSLKALVDAEQRRTQELEEDYENNGE